MAPLVSSIEISRPPAEVFAYVTDPARFAEWQGDVVSARAASDGRTFTTTRRIGPKDRTFSQEVTDSRPPFHWSARGLDGPLRPSMDMTLEPLADGTGSRVTFALDFAPRGIGLALLPLVRRQAAKGAPVSYRNLKRRLESGAA
ncbi:SRPBCC family protein [Streptomyces sp. CA-249302]|uniref:SRPBCC family protein n=1 Tax=Streptomyces sp. CA-249302 TaxID=3240058 RepID=UPI003D8C4752